MHYWKMDFHCIPLVISDQIAQLCPFTSGAVYPPCQKPLVRSCQTFVYNCLSTQNEYPIILQFINHWFTPFKCPNAVAVGPGTCIIYTPCLETVGSQLPNIWIECLFYPVHIPYIPFFLETAKSWLPNIQIKFLFHSKHIPYIPPVRKSCILGAPESMLYQLNIFDRWFTSMYVQKSQFSHMECQSGLVV